MPIEKIPIVPEIMRIDTGTQAIDMQQIDNRRFLFNPKTGALVLGKNSLEKRRDFQAAMRKNWRLLVS